jgi:hypothetical protein
MIKSVTVTNHLGESIILELRRPEKSGLLVQGIDGLGPSKANINTTELSTIDGSLYNSAKVTSRNIIFRLAFLSDSAIETIRQLSYKFFPIKKRIKLKFETDNRTCETYGYVESNEPNIFSSQEGTQISIVCPDPYFYATNKTVSVFYSVYPLMEFEFSNESLTDDLIELSNVQRRTQQTIYYSGDADVGLLISIHAYGNVENITIYNTETLEQMKIDTAKLAALTGSSLINRDELIISTKKGSKSVTLLRNGAYTNVLNCLDKNSDWFQLSKGDNIFAYTAEVGDDKLGFRIEHQAIYEGV